jgi:hypothetical protein
MTNPLLADIPASVVEDMAPLLPLAWLTAGVLVRARERQSRSMRRTSDFACLREEGSIVERAMAIEDDTVSADSLRLQIRVPLSDGEDLDLICERLAMQDDSWAHVGAWTQVTSYEYSLPGAPRGPIQVRTTARPTLRGMDISHEEPVGQGCLPLCESLQRVAGFQRVTRRPWSRREDAANAVSDLWVRWRRPWGTPPPADFAAGTVLAGDALAAAGFVTSEIWDNHVRILDETWIRDGGCGISDCGATLLVWYAKPVDPSLLSGIVGRARVVHRMEKRLQSSLLRLTISCECAAPTFQQAEQGLWRNEGTRRWITLEAEDMPAWLRDTTTTPLAQALVLLRPLLAFRLVTARQLVPCGPGSGEAKTETLWHASFLARACTTDETLAAQLPHVCSVVEQLQQGKLCENIVDLFGEWGVFYGGEAAIGPEHCAPPPKPFPTSGSMPRLFRVARTDRFVARPKLFLADLPPEDRLWSWELPLAE